jgi:uracil DNA glycosylase
MAQLRTEIRSFLQDWRTDVSSSWQDVLDGAEPNIEAIDEALTLEDGETIFPGRKGHPAAGARADSHIFRALDGLRPHDVNAVVLGQDPYPRASRATGRAFEQGDLLEWSPDRTRVAESLRRIVQVAASHRSGDAKYVSGDVAWSRLVADAQANRISIARPRDFFDKWQRQGVLCINAGLTLSRFEPAVQKAHFALWRPIVKRLLTSLATQPNRSIGFILWGGVALNTFNSLGILDAAENAGTRDRVAVVRHAHPGAEDQNGQPLFFGKPNTFTDARDRLSAIGGPVIEW